MTETRRGVLAPTRRAFLLSTALLAAAGALPRFAFAAEPVKGGTLTFNIGTEPPVLVLIAHTAGAAYNISGKVNEGLLTYDADFNPQPLLATEWKVAEDGLRYWFKLREGVKWHDGEDFTAKDVAFSIQALKDNHPRGRATYASVASINVLASHEVELILAKPAPFLLKAFASFESPIVPKHLYEGTNIPENPHNIAPVGTGPFVFKEWVRGSHAIFTRNEAYWDNPKPYLDQIIFRFIIDPAAAVAGIETGEVLLSVANIPLTDVDRLKSNPNLVVDTTVTAYSPSISRAEFNFDNPYLANVKVRQAIAHAVDRDFIVNTIYLGYAKRLDGPVSPDLAAFFSSDLPVYSFDPAEAEKLLDEAGFPRGADGKRFKLFIDPTQPSGPPKQTAEYFAQALGKVGIEVELRSQDFATFVKRVYADRDFDIAIEGMSNLYDPTVGIQRLYWSKNYKPGVPFSNGAHYSSAETDRLLEAASIEVDPKKRYDLFVDFQKQVVADLPALDIVAPDTFTISDKRVKNLNLGVEYLWNNGAQIYIES
ncbi:MAG: Extracellular solute-binding protein family 5 middle family protein 13 [Devosia sp.]|uniref:ABC transporter substrate-binding protein n=1 Tax=Devosia sp. TaxID=1871048 RepID=UPI00260ABF30|nr:ABC transporter substrate-binding protein [Devosia sp.]MDB5587712.1 Extracellular solute-binding protein family 5 middle family protein 13 [Devosia sp.]